MKTLFLGSYGFGNLGDELCLMEALRRFPSREAWAFSQDPEYTGRCTGVVNFIAKRAEIERVRPERVVLGGGGVGFFPSIRDSLHWMRDAYLMGAECHIHNIGVARMREYAWLTEDQVVQQMLRELKSCSVRDDVSYFCMREWPVEMRPGITYYPETDIEASGELVPLLPRDKPLLGISVLGRESMRRALAANAPRVRAYLQQFRGGRVVPIISTVHRLDAEEDDVAGFNHFRELFLEGFEVVATEMLDRDWWRANMTPARLKGVIGALHWLVSQRKHNCIHAIGTGRRFTGLFPADDDSIMRVFYTMRSRILPGSTLLALPV